MRTSIFKLALIVMTAVAIVSCQTEDEALFPEMNTTATKSVSVDDVGGVYTGTLHNVIMSGKKKSNYPNQVTKITVSDEYYDSFNFHFDMQVGGKVNVHLTADVKNIALNSDGTFEVNAGDDSLSKALKIAIFKYDITLLKGKFIPKSTGGYDVEWTMESNGFYLQEGKIMAHVEFTTKPVQ